MVREREQWGTRAGFILAAVGSAIGLGNIWRFPYIAYDNGGGAFLLPYLIALVTAGIPLLIMEYTIGRRAKGSPPLAFRALSRPAETIGWWQVAICFIIATYYAGHHRVGDPLHRILLRAAVGCRSGGLSLR